MDPKQTLAELCETVKDLRVDLQAASRVNHRMLHVISRRLMLIEIAAFILRLPVIIAAFLFLVGALAMAG